MTDRGEGEQRKEAENHKHNQTTHPRAGEPAHPAPTIEAMIVTSSGAKMARA